MRETLKMMNQIIIGYEKEENLDNLIKQYQDTKAPNILAYLYKEYFGLISSIVELYPTLTEQDIASFAVQMLDKALLSYDNITCKFSTYFIKCLKNRLRSETQALRYDKRKIITFCDSEDSYDGFYEDDYFDIDNFISYNNLTNEEGKICELLTFGYSFKDIAQLIGKSLPYVYLRNSKIKQKILNNV